MAHWKLTLAYNGTGFHGWQIQPGLATIQGTLARALHGITGETVLPQGAGRTDTGVHALAQVASVSLQSPVPPLNLQRALNRILPAGIRVLAAEIAPATFHARHSARGKHYEYRIFERRPSLPNAIQSQERICSPFLAPFVWDCRWPLALDAMQTASIHLVGTQDFSAMAASNRNGSAPGEDEAVSEPNPIKTIHKAAWTREDDLLVFRIQGSGFLHHMVRNLVGTLVDIGRGSLTPDDLPRILASRDRSQAGPTAPANGLFLVEVLYPNDPGPTPVAQFEEVAQ
jgi:tRNA pseudouridine38-40 synthase